MDNKILKSQQMLIKTLKTFGQPISWDACAHIARMQDSQFSVVTFFAFV